MLFQSRCYVLDEFFPDAGKCLLAIVLFVIEFRGLDAMCIPPAVHSCNLIFDVQLNTDVRYVKVAYVLAVHVYDCDGEGCLV